MDRDYFHWGATAEIMEIIRKRRKSPETLRLVERRLDGELMSRANRFGGGYRPLEERAEEEEQETQQPEILEEAEPESEGESQVIRGDNFPIVDLKAFNTEGKEAQFIQINQVIGKITGNKKLTEETI